MVTYKTKEDFLKMEMAGKVVSNIHYEIYTSAKPGMTLKDLDNIARNCRKIKRYFKFSWISAAWIN